MSARLDLVVGCDGAGKSTLVETVLAPILVDSAFVNADEIAKACWPEDPEVHSYDAAKIAARTRSALLARGCSFIAETVFSHPSKLDLITEAHDRGFRVVLHVVMVPEDYAVERVRLRVVSGGHAVPEDKIRQRYARLWPLVATAIQRCEQATVYDNQNRTTRVVARFVEGSLVAEPHWPSWTPDALTNPARYSDPE
ncbi:MAG: zeta toxin family protein [Rhodococcus sp. (in: high G+C Gram-positive bacteria)]|uniref:zeta toxin family protein n=1 Tax=Rhodococcus sp. TaxID=1831 RepID=UPI003BB01BA9